MHRPSAVRSLAFLALASVTALAAGCASQSNDPPTPSGPSPAVLAAQPGAVTALDLMKQGGTFMFSLDESGPSTPMRAKCSADNPGDAAKADACYAAIRAVGAAEGMRFAPDAQGRVVWTSFGHEEGKEVVFIEAALTLVVDGDHAVLSSFAEAPRGPQLAGEREWASKKIRIELPEAGTLVMNDPSKGKLVFHRVER